MKKKIIHSDEEWKKKLTPEQYRILRKKGTERPFTGEYCGLKEKGLYRCAACDEPLFLSDDKFESGTGWPSYTRPVNPDAILYKPDGDRTEILCARCDSHLGHVFNDGPPPTGQRYCLNSASLKFEKK